MYISREKSSKNFYQVFFVYADKRAVGLILAQDLANTTVMGCEEDRRTACSVRRQAQQGVKCWGCEEMGYCLWVCPNKVAYPVKGEVQQKQVRKVEVKEVVKRKWH